MELGFLILMAIIVIGSLGTIIWIVCDSDIMDKSIIIPFFVALVFSTILLIFSIKKYNEPHHGSNPTLKDVPKQAHIDTIRTIRNGNESVSYELVWNK